MQSSRVSIIKCSTYDQDKVFNAVKQAIDYLGGIEKFVQKNSRVLIKPNLLAPKPPEKHVTTHPEVLRAVIKLVNLAGGKCFVGDSPGGSILKDIPGKVLSTLDKYWETSGMKKVCTEERAEIISFETSSVEIFKIKNRKHTPELVISKAALSFDVLINLPKLKTHGMLLYTGAIKNLFGCVPGLRKSTYHKCAIHPNDFGQMLVDILTIVKPNLNIIDGIIGMDGDGPSAGRLRDIGVILASEDTVAIDAIGEKILGFNKNDVSTTRIANKQSLGQGNLEKIEISGEPLENVILKDAKKPSNIILHFIPQFFVSMLGKFIWASPKINTSKCTICKVCVESCPVKTIIIEEKYPKVIRKNCIGCLCCHELCAYNAIDLQLSWLANKFIK